MAWCLDKHRDNFTFTFTDITTKMEKSFGKNGRRPPFTFGIPFPTERMTKRVTTKATMERPRPSWDS